MWAAAALFVLLYTFVAVLIVDLAGLRVGEGFVGVCYFDKLLLDGFITAGRGGKVSRWL